MSCLGASAGRTKDTAIASTSIAAIRIVCGLYAGSGRNRAVFGHDHDTVADEVAVSVGLVDPVHVDEPRTVADARVLVDDDAIEHDVASNAFRRSAARVIFQSG